MDPHHHPLAAELFGQFLGGHLHGVGPDGNGHQRRAIFRRLRGVDLPQVLPYFRAAADTALGLSWKAGTAAEVIGLCSGTIGERLYTAKVYFQTADLFAWTAVIVLLSVLFENLFLRGVDALTERWCA